MAESFIKDQKKTLPCAAYIDGEYGINKLLAEKGNDLNSLSEFSRFAGVVYDICKIHYSYAVEYAQKRVISETSELLAKYKVGNYDDGPQNVTFANEVELYIQLCTAVTKHYNQALTQAGEAMEFRRPVEQNEDEFWSLCKGSCNDTEKQTISLVKFKCRMCGGKSVISPDEDNEYFCPI